MSGPYRRFLDGEIVRAEDWNDIQSVIKTEVRTHRHGGGAGGEVDPARLGGRLRAAGLVDGAVTVEKIAPHSVSARAIGAGVVKVGHLAPGAAIDEGKIEFDPDEPPAAAQAVVKVRLDPGDKLDAKDVRAIPRDSAVTSVLPKSSHLEFRTVADVALDAGHREVLVTCHSVATGKRYNVESKTLNRIGVALDRKAATLSVKASVDGLTIRVDISPPAHSGPWQVPKGSAVRIETGHVAETLEAVSLAASGHRGSTLATILSPGDGPPDGWTGPGKLLDLGPLEAVQTADRRPQVDQIEAARGGADGGSSGHDHGDGSLAPGCVGAEQVADGAIGWNHLAGDHVLGKLKRYRDVLRDLAKAMERGSVIGALEEQVQRSTP